MDLQECSNRRQEWPHQGHTSRYITLFMSPLTSICYSSIEIIETLEDGGTRTINRSRNDEEASGVQGPEALPEHLQSE